MEKELKHSEKKAYEIVYALFRIAGIVKNARIAEYLEDGAMKYLKAAISMNLNSAIEAGRELEFYLRIGQDLNFIHPENAQAVITEAKNLNEYLVELTGRVNVPESLKLSFSGKENKPAKERETLQDIKLSLDNINKQIEILSENDGEIEADLSGIIQPIERGQVIEEPKKIGLKIERQRPFDEASFENATSTTLSTSQDKRAPISVAKEVPVEEDAKLNIFNGETRQMAIYELIRQFGKESGNGCRMRDLQESFSGVSERTIRYDLEKLMEMGLIERAGQSGPSTYYRTKQITNNYQLITKAK